MIQFEKEILDFLRLPSIPKKEHDGKASFKDGVAIVNLVNGGQAYAVCTFDSEQMLAPKVKRVFGTTPYKNIEKIFVVPSYMDDKVEDMDLSPKDKERAEQLVKEAQELENEGVEVEQTPMPESEYCYDHITNDEQAMAFIREWNKRHGMKKGKVPTTHEGITSKLLAMWMDDNRTKK